MRREAMLPMVWTLLASAAPAQDAPLPQVLAVQKVMQDAIARAEPSIACILVSRSDAYRRLGMTPLPERPGTLGDFDARKLNHLERDEAKALRRRLDLADPAHVPESFGSGIVIDPQGLVLTNYHVIQDATKLFVRLPGGVARYADIVAADQRCDLAVLRMTGDRLPPLKAISLGDAGTLTRGQWILSLANPYAAGFRDGQPSASWGILSNIRRRYPGTWSETERAGKPLSHFGTLLQIDARLNLGCSGGALLNLQGECVGLTSALAALEGGETPGGFAIPLDAGMKRILDVLKRGEEVEYGFLGVTLPAPDEIPKQSPGVPIAGVLRGSPAMVGGLDGMPRDPATDVIVRVNGRPVHDADDLLVALSSELAGAKVQLEVLKRGIERKTIEVRLAKFLVPSKRIVTSLGPRPYFRGVRVDYTSLLAQPPGLLREIPPGVLVAHVQPQAQVWTADAGKPARTELRPGEIITHVGAIAVNTPAEFYAAVQAARDPIEVTVSTHPTEPARRLHLK
jgi:serine protease Do